MPNMCSSGSVLVCLVGISALYFSVASAHRTIPDRKYQCSSYYRFSAAHLTWVSFICQARTACNQQKALFDFEAQKLSSLFTRKLTSGLNSVVVGNYRPQVDSNGNLYPAQCHAGTGYCWCVDWDGTALGEKVRGEDPISLNCEQKRQERMQPPTIADRPPPQHSNGDSTF